MMGSSENPKRQANKALVPAIASSSGDNDGGGGGGDGDDDDGDFQTCGDHADVGDCRVYYHDDVHDVDADDDDDDFVVGGGGDVADDNAFYCVSPTLTFPPYTFPLNGLHAITFFLKTCMHSLAAPCYIVPVRNMLIVNGVRQASGVS
ncbi:hypothetical protein SprV_0200539500 [Sparganum proliferum]